AEELFARRQCERHELEQCLVYLWRKCLFADQCAPSTIAGISRRDMRKALLTHRRADSIRTDQQIRLDDFAIRKMPSDPIVVLFKFRETSPTVIVIGRECIAQQTVNALPGGQHLWTFGFVS